METLSGLGVVVIGRNEGERLRRCLLSIQAQATAIVYVDSGSRDGSVATATDLGVMVHELDLARPFTAARARNAGVQALVAAAADVEHIQFVDGDCEMACNWLRSAGRFLDHRPDVVAVSGRLRERFPERSIYNLLCDLEWDTPLGAAKACGGIVLVRRAAFQQVGGFLEDLIAGEEPELCVRLRANGGVIWRLEDEMAFHDAAMTRFSQWWRRSMRTGFAYAQGASLHGSPPERHWVRETRSAWIWGLALPIFVVGGAIAHPGFLLGFLLYPLQVARIYARGKGQSKERLVQAFFFVLGKFSEAAGALKFAASKLIGRRTGLIEYK